jgi:hypothetical protein
MIALSGFGDDTAASTGVKAFIAPTIGSVIAAAIGALAWKGHRVAGGAIGAVAGLGLGFAIGQIMKKGEPEIAWPSDFPPVYADMPPAPTPGGGQVIGGGLKMPGLTLPNTIGAPSQFLNIKPPVTVGNPLTSDGTRLLTADATKNAVLSVPTTQKAPPKIGCGANQVRAQNGTCVEMVR